MRALYVIGGPGVGKSTLMGDLLCGWTWGEYERFTYREMFGHYGERSSGERGAYLGRLRDEYPGTDALSRSVMPQALLWLVERPELDWVYGEGERLGSAKFLWPLHLESGLLVVHLTAEPEVSAARRAGRPGKPVPEGTFIRAKTTQAANVANACREAGIQVLELDANQPVHLITRKVLARHPAVG